MLKGRAKFKSFWSSVIFFLILLDGGEIGGREFREHLGRRVEVLSYLILIAFLLQLASPVHKRVYLIGSGSSLHCSILWVDHCFWAFSIDWEIHLNHDSLAFGSLECGLSLLVLIRQRNLVTSWPNYWSVCCSWRHSLVKLSTIVYICKFWNWLWEVFVSSWRLSEFVRKTAQTSNWSERRWPIRRLILQMAGFYFPTEWCCFIQRTCACFHFLIN